MRNYTEKSKDLVRREQLVTLLTYLFEQIQRFLHFLFVKMLPRQTFSVYRAQSLAKEFAIQDQNQFDK